MTKTMMVRLIVEENSNADPLLVAVGPGNVNDMNDKVLLENSLYEDIFGSTFDSQGSRPWKRGVVELSVGDRTIRRLFAGGNSHRVEAGHIGVTAQTVAELGLGDICEKEVRREFHISKGGRFAFYWNHPSHVVRASYKLGLLSVTLGLIALPGSIKALCDWVCK
jgi:hypothetical protein